MTTQDLDGLRECGAPDCARPVPRTVFMCRQHWYQVPPQLRTDVNRAWRAYQHNRGPLSALLEAQAAADALDPR